MLVPTWPKIYEICDDKPIFATLKSSFCKQHCFNSWFWNYELGDFTNIQQSLLNVPWQYCITHSDHEDVFKSWQELFLTVAESSIPHYCTTIRPCDKDFMNSRIRQLILKQDRLHGQLKSRPDNINLEQNYKAVRNKVVNEIGKAKLKNIQI